MEVGKVRSRERSSRREWWVEVTWHGDRLTFSNIPVYHQDRIEWYPCDSEEKAKFLLTIIQDRLKDNRFHPAEFRKQSPISFRTYSDKWLKKRKARVGTGTIKQYKAYIKNYLQPFFGDTYLPNINKTKLEELQIWVKGSIKTKKNVMDTLRSILRDACPDYIPAVPKFPEWTGNFTLIPPVIETISLEDFWKIWGHIPAEDRYIFMFMILSGCRTSEARAFRKQDIKSDEIMFVVTFDSKEQEMPVKGKKPKPFPLTEGLKHLFDIVPPNLTPRVFVNPRTGREYSTHINDIWNAACKKAGFPYIKLYNATRHAFATMLDNSGTFSLDEIQDLLRHSEMKMTRRYAHRKVKRLAQKVDNVINFPGKSVGNLLATENDASN